MINITGTYKEISMVLPSTNVGTCDYNARIFDITGEILHNVKAVNGTKLQWVTNTVSLMTIEEDAINKIAELMPYPDLPDREPQTGFPELPPPPAPINW